MHFRLSFLRFSTASPPPCLVPLFVRKSMKRCVQGADAVGRPGRARSQAAPVPGAKGNAVATGAAESGRGAGPVHPPSAPAPPTALPPCAAPPQCRPRHRQRTRHGSVSAATFRRHRGIQCGSSVPWSTLSRAHLGLLLLAPWAPSATSQFTLHERCPGREMKRRPAFLAPRSSKDGRP